MQQLLRRMGHPLIRTQLIHWESFESKSIPRQADRGRCVARGPPIDDRIADKQSLRALDAGRRHQMLEAGWIRLARKGTVSAEHGASKKLFEIESAKNPARGGEWLVGQHRHLRAARQTPKPAVDSVR